MAKSPRTAAIVNSWQVMPRRRACGVSSSTTGAPAIEVA
jgi:hypothetical protein